MSANGLLEILRDIGLRSHRNEEKSRMLSIESQQMVRNRAVHWSLQTRGPVESEVGEFKVEKNFTSLNFSFQRYDYYSKASTSYKLLNNTIY